MAELAVVVASAAAGLVAGAFVPLVAYRLSVPAEEPVRASCHACAAPLGPGWRGWLGSRRGWLGSCRCAACGARLGPPTWATSMIAGAACAGVALALGPLAVLPMYLALAVLAVLLGAVDLACRRLPHAVVVPAFWVSSALFLVVAGLTAQWASLLRAGLGAAALGAVFLLLHLVPGGGLGFGDVKLAVLLGLFLGWLGWGAVVLGGLLPWLLNAPVVIGLLASGRIGRRESVPFGPAMLAAALVAIGVSGWVAVVGRS